MYTRITIQTVPKHIFENDQLTSENKVSTSPYNMSTQATIVLMCISDHISLIRNKPTIGLICNNITIHVKFLVYKMTFKNHCDNDYWYKKKHIR